MTAYTTIKIRAGWGLPATQIKSTVIVTIGKTINQPRIRLRSDLFYDITITNIGSLMSNEYSTTLDDSQDDRPTRDGLNSDRMEEWFDRMRSEERVYKPLRIKLRSTGEILLEY